MSWLDVAQEVIEAYTEAQKSLGTIKPAELERRLKSMNWRFIQPLSVGDDLSIVLKLGFRQPDEEKLRQLATTLRMKLGAMKSFDQVLISEEGGYFGVGKGMLRISAKFPRESLLEALNALLC